MSIFIYYIFIYFIIRILFELYLNNKDFCTQTFFSFYVLCIYLYNIKRDFVTWISRQTKVVWIKKHKISLILKAIKKTISILLTMWGQSNVDHQNMTYKYNIRINNINIYILVHTCLCVLCVVVLERRQAALVYCFVCVCETTGQYACLFVWLYWVYTK